MASRNYQDDLFGVNKPEEYEPPYRSGEDQDFDGRELELEKRSIENNLLKQKFLKRNEIWTFSKWLLIVSCVVTAIILIFQAIDWWIFGYFRLDNKIIMSITAGLLVEIVGVLYVVARQVFDDKGRD
ncbi:hypothetical protein F4X86_01425 [Candidatus Saccharibacteria bacterium]|nr:hypothetical protein [Candidatus Saccharibacteria bacterium]